MPGGRWRPHQGVAEDDHVPEVAVLHAEVEGLRELPDPAEAQQREEVEEVEDARGVLGLDVADLEGEVCGVDDHGADLDGPDDVGDEA